MAPAAPAGGVESSTCGAEGGGNVCCAQPTEAVTQAPTQRIARSTLVAVDRLRNRLVEIVSIHSPDSRKLARHDLKATTVRPQSPHKLCFQYNRQTRWNGFNEKLRRKCARPSNNH